MQSGASQPSSLRSRRARTYRGVTLQRPANPPLTPPAVLKDAVRRAIQKNLAKIRAIGTD
jgi:hypothetical protein